MSVTTWSGNGADRLPHQTAEISRHVTVTLKSPLLALFVAGTSGITFDGYTTVLSWVLGLTG